MLWPIWPPSHTLNARFPRKAKCSIVSYNQTAATASGAMKACAFHPGRLTPLRRKAKMVTALIRKLYLTHASRIQTAVATACTVMRPCVCLADLGKLKPP